MSGDHTNAVNDGYDVFDEDMDGTWSYSEFKTFKSMLNNHSALFNKMDVDNDTIVSIREFIGHLMNVHGVTKYIFNKRFVCFIRAQFQTSHQI